MTLEELNIKILDKIEDYQKLVNSEKELKFHTAHYKEFVDRLVILKSFKEILSNKKFITETSLKLIELELEKIENSISL